MLCIIRKIKVYFLFLLLLCSSYNLQSQAVYSSKEQSRIGFIVGMTASQLYRDTMKYEAGIFFNAGLNYALSFSDKSNISIDLNLSGITVKRSNPIIKYRFFYIELPIYYQYKFSDNFRLNLGLQYSQPAFTESDSLDGAKGIVAVTRKSFSTKMGSDLGVLAGIEFDITPNLTMATRYTISAKSFGTTSDPYFGVFNVSFKIVLYHGYREIIHKKEKTKATF